MGKRGPKPTPREILQLRGSRRADATGDEPEVDRSLPDAPDYLDELAIVCWDRIVPRLHAMRVLATIDVQAIARYCVLWSRWHRAEEFIKQRGETYLIKDQIGGVKYVQQWPQVAIAHRLSLALSKIESEFGMTPSSRSRIVTSKDTATPRAAIFEFLSGAEKHA